MRQVACKLGYKGEYNMDGRTVHKTLNLTGLSCLACETKIEKKLTEWLASLGGA